MKKIFETILVSVVAGWTLLLVIDAKAALLEFRSSSQSVPLGSAAEVDLWITGSNPALGIGAYDVKLNFDPSILSFHSFSPSTAFGTTLGPFITPSQEAVSIADVSLELPATLLSLQTVTDFELGAFLFDTLSVGTGLLGISNVTLGDVNGDRVAVDSLRTGRVTVSQATIPEPGSLLLFGIGLAGLVAVKRNTVRGNTIFR